jgi:tRNA threonylcarbamoyl adenosine modification protein (Sua5/YciO/YrdC/YwlC family)
MERTRGIAEAVSAVRRGELIVLPTDTVYGIGADAFTPAAVTALLEAKGHGRDMPAPVLVGSVRAAQALVEDFGTYGQDLVDEFWPGALTLVCRANSTLAWDLGDAKGTVAIRMPLHQLTLELLKETGPMAVSSANRAGAPPARAADDAEAQLGDAVEVYLDDGPSGDDAPSSIVDLTGAVPRLLRVGAISEARLREVCGVLLSDEDEPAADADEPGKTDEPAKADEPADAEESAKADEPAKAEEPADAEEPAKADEPAKAEASVKAGETVEKEAAKAERSGDADGSA